MSFPSFAPSRLYSFLTVANDPGYLDLFLLCLLPKGYILTGGDKMILLSRDNYYLPVQIERGISKHPGLGCIRRRIDIRNNPNWSMQSIRLDLSGPGKSDFDIAWLSLTEIHDRPIQEGIEIAVNRPYHYLTTTQSNEFRVGSILIPFLKTDLSELDNAFLQLFGKLDQHSITNFGVLDQKTAIFLVDALCFNEDYEERNTDMADLKYLSIAQIHLDNPGDFMEGDYDLLDSLN